MAVPKIKTTYSLDLETIQSLEEIASRCQIPKSEVVRRAVAVLASSMPSEEEGRLQALDLLQASLALTDETATRWVEQVKAERSATSRRLEGDSA